MSALRETQSASLRMESVSEASASASKSYCMQGMALLDFMCGLACKGYRQRGRSCYLLESEGSGDAGRRLTVASFLMMDGLQVSATLSCGAG